MDGVRNKIKKLVKADNRAEVIFTPSITIALNQILQGISFAQGDIVYLSPYEHNAVARVLHLIEKKIGIVLKEMPLKEDTLEIDIEKLQYLFSKNKPKCVCSVHVSNVTGYILPVEEIFELSKKYDAITVLDTAQSLGIVDIPANLKVDFLAFAGHKTLYGPLGIGGFVRCGNYQLEECFAGGTGSNSLNLDMPDDVPGKYEFASANIVAIKGLDEALNEVEIDSGTEKELLDYLIDRLSDIEGVYMYLPPRDKHIGMVSFTVEGYKSEDIGMILDEDYDIAVRTGYHCAPLIHKWLKDENVSGTVRVGIGKYNTRQQIDILIDAIEEILM
jgi:selenocysteine lyase/cysteine desulfurase